VAGIDAQAVGDAAQVGVQQSTNTGTSVQPPAPPSAINTNPQVPVPSPTPNSTPTATPPEIRSPR
jgi:hypothetical protein